MYSTTSLISAEVTNDNLDAQVNNIEALTRFLDEETGKLEHSVRELESAEGKLQTEKEQASELSRFLSGLENVGVSLAPKPAQGCFQSLAEDLAPKQILQFKTDQNGL